MRLKRKLLQLWFNVWLEVKFLKTHEHQTYYVWFERNFEITLKSNTLCGKTWGWYYFENNKKNHVSDGWSTVVQKVDWEWMGWLSLMVLWNLDLRLEKTLRSRLRGQGGGLMILQNFMKIKPVVKCLVRRKTLRSTRKWNMQRDCVVWSEPAD